MMDRPIRILAISGSLRAASSNSAILRVAARVAPAGIEVMPYEGIDTLPYFTPDLDRDIGDPLLPAPVRDLRARIDAADALLISSPEYAHGVPGVLKNALDWLVGGSEMVNKPVALLDTTAPSWHAQASLAETLRTMSARLVDEASVSISLRGRPRDDESLSRDVEVVSVLQSAMLALAATAAS